MIEHCEQKIIPQYTEKLSEEHHLANIKDLVKHIDKKKYGNLFDTEHKYRIGHAQKLLNLQLKYLWCAGMAVEPPHCPVDRIILNIVKWKGTSWTKMNKIEKYKKSIEAIREIAKEKNQSIAAWELEVYDRRKQNVL